MQLVYVVLAVVMVWGLLETQGVTAHLAAGMVLVGASALIWVRMSHPQRLVLGLVVMTLLAFAVHLASVGALIIVAYAALFFFSMLVPSWLSPVLLTVVFWLEIWPLEPVLALRLLIMAGLGSGAWVLGLLAHQNRAWEREQRSWFTTKSELSQSLKQVEYLAFHDALTGLPNRRLLVRHLEDSLTRVAKQGGALAVVYIDLDHFKAVNDGAGHEFGDRVLKAAAAAITRMLHPGDVVGRQGGDEFIIVLGSAATERDAMEHIEKLRLRLAEGLVLDSRRVYVTASFGVALYQGEHEQPEELLRRADLALYRAKEDGRNRVALFLTELEQEASNVYFLESGLRSAMEESQFFLEYQPQVDILSGLTVGVEALLRWHAPDGTVRMPDQFLPQAQKLGLMQDIDAWVLQHALDEMYSMRWWHESQIVLGVNVSATTLDNSEFVSRLQDLLALYAVEPGRLELEITESVMARNAEKMANQLHEIRRCGVGVAIDDFGVGYSSLSYLKHYPATRLKIDRLFVSDLPQSEAIARAIIAVAKSLGIALVAEGVETQEQAQVLVRLGCDVAQGFYYQRSVPASVLQIRYATERS
jgi:diguanylate cyclase (GGDEF)-like protein